MVFLKKNTPVRTKNQTYFLNDFMPIFKFACRCAVFKKFDTGFAQILFLKLKYIYLALIKLNIFLISLRLLYIGKKICNVLYNIKIKEIKL